MCLLWLVGVFDDFDGSGVGGIGLGVACRGGDGCSGRGGGGGGGGGIAQWGFLFSQLFCLSWSPALLTGVEGVSSYVSQSI